jgi:hypothetical protein
MRNRTRVIAAAAITAALAAGSTGAAVASTTGGKPGVHAKARSPIVKRDADRDLASRLGVSPTRLDQAVREAKISLSKASSKPTMDQLYATLARILGIPEARVRQAIPAGKPGGSKVEGKQDRAKAARPMDVDAFSAAVASALHASSAQVKPVLERLFVTGKASPSSPAFAAAARSLGVSIHQLTAAITHAKESAAGVK